jgi:putative transposase
MFKSNVPEAQKIFKEIIRRPEKMFDMLRIDVKKACEKAISELIQAELTHFLGREHYARLKSINKNYRNGSYIRNYTARHIGTLSIKVARDRNGEFNSQLIKKYDRYEKSIEKDMSLLFLSGLSTRNISLISNALIGRKISHAEVSKVNNELQTGIDAWRNRPLHDVKIKYMYIDGVFFPMRIQNKVEKQPFLVVIGVTEDNRKIFLAIQQGDKESSTAWREIFKDLKFRGLDATLVQLGIMDGLPGLEKVFCEEFINAKVQRCQVHVSRNVLCKVPKPLKQPVVDYMRNIFYADSRKKAIANYNEFVNKYNDKIPSAVKSLSNCIDSCLTFYSFPKEQWVSLRTTNPIERVNKEFKRRTKPMEIVAGENSAYRLLCFIGLKMELHWRSAPLGKNLPKEIDQFTQNT